MSDKPKIIGKPKTPLKPITKTLFITDSYSLNTIKFKTDSTEKEKPTDESKPNRKPSDNKTEPSS